MIFGQVHSRSTPRTASASSANTPIVSSTSTTSDIVRFLLHRLRTERVGQLGIHSGAGLKKADPPPAQTHTNRHTKH
jgi:hypothetical protein